jgi:thiosulfate/3-mercaptopyruvate sulfurtransferase
MLICSVLIVLNTTNAAGAQAGSELLVQTNWLAAHLNDSNVVILHLAPYRRSYDAGHIPGARFLPLSDVTVTRNGMPNQLPVVDDLKAASERVGIGDRSRVAI